jgi:hypothetical protein
MPACNKGADCKTKDCRFEHPDGVKPPTVCRFGLACRHKDTKCRDIHEESKDTLTPNTVPKKDMSACNKGADCKTKDCRFEHPDGVRPQTARQNNDSTRSAIHEEPQLTPRSVQKEPKAKHPKAKPVCHKGVNCTVKDCKYNHPDGINPCKHGLNCKNKDTTCGAIHEESKDDASENSQRKAKPPKAKPVCNKGVDCTTKDCKYDHPDGINPPTDCKYGLNCKNKDTTCSAIHRAIDDPERKITYHVSLPNAPNMSLKESIEPLLPKL